MLSYKVEDFADNIKLASHLKCVSDVNDLISIQKRFVNAKRDFLFVNKLQGKHIATRPRDFDRLTSDLTEEFISNAQLDKNAKILVIGFAETATALANSVVIKLINKGYKDVYYSRTTRDKVYTCLGYDSLEEVEQAEDIPVAFKQDLHIKGDYIRALKGPVVSFSEEHSHAVGQLLYWRGTDNDIAFDYVLFIDDEITTGKTVCNLKRGMINTLNGLFDKYPFSKARFGVLSVLNFMTEECIDRFKVEGIDIYALIRGTLKDDRPLIEDKYVPCFEDIKISEDKVVNKSLLCTKLLLPAEKGPIKYNTEVLKGIADLKVCEDTNYNRADAWGILYNMLIADKDYSNILVLGVEEEMYIPMLFAEGLESKGCNVFYKASTRSPIAVNGRGILSKGYCFDSLYDDVTTYIYDNIDEPEYDLVIVVSTVQDNLDYKDSTILDYAKGKAKQGVCCINLLRIKE